MARPDILRENDPHLHLRATHDRAHAGRAARCFRAMLAAATRPAGRAISREAHPMPTPPAQPLTRTTTLTGVGFIAFFIASVVSSNPPANSASDAKWAANYTGTSNQLSHLTTGIALILAALCLLTFLTGVWQRINYAGAAGRTSHLPLVAAGVAATCIATGGTLMAYISGSELSGAYPLPSADLLRLSNGLGFVMTGIPGMAATALCLAVLAHQARAVGVFGRNMAIFTWLVAAVLLLSFLFVPILALMAWIVVCIVNARRATRARVEPASRPGTRTSPSVA